MCGSGRPGSRVGLGFGSGRLGCPGLGWLGGDGGRSAPGSPRRWPIYRHFLGVSGRRIDHRLWSGIEGGRCAPGRRPVHRHPTGCIDHRPRLCHDGGRCTDATRRRNVGGSATVWADQGRIDHRRFRVVDQAVDQAARRRTTRTTPHHAQPAPSAGRAVLGRADRRTGEPETAQMMFEWPAMTPRSCG